MSKLTMSLCVLTVLSIGLPLGAQPVGPAVFFHHGIHDSYAAKPLHDMGVELDVPAKGQTLAGALATRKYNVVVTGILTPEEIKVLDGFLAEGGGVMVCAPLFYSREADFTATCQWLTGLGARPRWEMLQDSDKNNSVRDVMNCQLSFSNNIAAPFNKGVSGVLTLECPSTTGWEPPMSYDLDTNWTVTVRGAKSLKTVIDQRNDVVLQPWIPKQPIASEPPLLAVRQVGKGRLAVLGIRYYWLFTPPYNCPTAQAMLTAGAGEKKSQWLKVFANTFEYLAAPGAQAGLGGIKTPPEVLKRPVEVWAPAPEMNWADWAKNNPLESAAQPQTRGLIGARTELSGGTGRVADYVKAAKAASLQFVVFMEDNFKMDQAKWDRLVADCKAASDEKFLAAPGLCYQDAQGNHLYAFGDSVRLPKDAMLLSDRRLATVGGDMRNRAYFDYVNEYISQNAIVGYWNHKANVLIPADYKMYNSFPIYSFVDGKQVDDALADYLYLQGIGGCQGAVAFEFVTSPEQLTKRAKDGWSVVALRPLKALDGDWHGGVYSFSGLNGQYITNGPRILYWEGTNRLVGGGQWWRPDQWEWRIRLRVASDDGLKSVTIHDGDRQVLRRWLVGGQKEFAKEIILSNGQQVGATLVVEDVKGRQAVSMSFWNRNLMKEEFFCSDRCNFLGSSRLRTRQGAQMWTPVGFQGNMGITPSKGLLDMTVSPAVSLTMDSPTLPIDGAPPGFPTCALRFEPMIPGEHPFIYAYPQTHMVSPEIGIGQADYRLAFDPAERDAVKTPLGHDYQKPQTGWGNAWGGWHRLVPTQKAEGYLRTYAWNWVPGEFRIGWHEASLKAKDDITVPAGQPGLQVMTTPNGGWQIYRDGQELETSLDTPKEKAIDLFFMRGTFAVLQDKGGSDMLIPLDGELTIRLANGTPTLYYSPAGGKLAKGQAMEYRVAFAGASGAGPDMPSGTPVATMLKFAQDFGVAQPGQVGYKATLTRGKQLDNYLYWRLDGQGSGVEAKIPKAALNGLLAAVVENLNDNWSVQLLDKGMAWPNHRSLPIRDGKAYAELDLSDHDADLFLGHPVTADNKDLRLEVAWEAKGLWYVEAHNPTDKPIQAKLATSPGWSPFALAEQVDLPPGTSKVWHVQEKPPK